LRLTATRQMASRVKLVLDTKNPRNEERAISQLEAFSILRLFHHSFSFLPTPIKKQKIHPIEKNFQFFCAIFSKSLDKKIWA
jgi:hypothetical protein